MIYEERTTVLKSGVKQIGDPAADAALQGYLKYCRDSLWPGLSDAGGRIICLLSGLIGDPANQLVQITSYPDLSAWQDAQERFPAERIERVESEEARILKPVSSRPKDPVPSEDRRAVYGYRRFFIDPADQTEFVRCSEEGVWPLAEARGCNILGLWTTASATAPMELVLATGYDGPAHWAETRLERGQPEGVDEQVWEQGRSLRTRRIELIQATWVSLMRSIDLE